MRENSASFTIECIDELRSILPPLNTTSETIREPLTSLSRYLNHYKLPTPGNGLAFYAGQLPSPSDHQIATMAWQPENALGCAVIVHGYLDHTGLFGHLIDYLLQQKMAVVCFDLPGHGLSDGEPAHIDCFSEYLHALHQVMAFAHGKFGQPLHLLGQSTGGAVIFKHLLHLSDKQPPAASINLLAPLVRPRLWRLNKFMYKTTRSFRQSVPRNFRSNSSDAEFLDMLRNRDPFQALDIPMTWVGAMAAWVDEIEQCAPNAYPLTVLQGTADTTLRWKYNMKVVAEKFPNACIKLIDGAGHHMANEAETIRKSVFESLVFKPAEI